MAYVRQLERLYDDLSRWRDAYVIWDRQATTERRAEGFAQRQEHLEEAQHRLMRVITHLHELPDLS